MQKIMKTPDQIIEAQSGLAVSERMVLIATIIVALFVAGHSVSGGQGVDRTIESITLKN